MAKKYLSLLLLSFLVGTLLQAAPKVCKKSDRRQLPSNYDMIVAYYGRPGTKALGILGYYPLPTLIEKVKARAKVYEEALNHTHHVTPAFDLIYDLAITEPGKNGHYLLPLPKKILKRYIEAAQKAGVAVFLDIQLGKKTPAQAIKPLLPYLAYDNVHFAIDPEFSVDDLDVRPGKVIGSITGEQVNEAQQLMSRYLKTHHIPQEKILIVHMFSEHMVTHKARIRYYPGIHLIMNLDGHGSPALKIRIYNGLYTECRAARVAGGFKLFLKKDKPLMSPKEALGLKPVGRYRIKDMPKYISYQ